MTQIKGEEGKDMELRVERMESVIAPGGIMQAISDFVRGFLDGLR